MTSFSSNINFEKFEMRNFISSTTTSSFLYNISHSILHHTLAQNQTQNKNASSNYRSVLYIPDTAAYLAFVCALLISLVGVAGNSITIAALVKFAARLNSHATTRFVINLAMADLIFCLLVLPLNAGRYLMRAWPFGQLACRLYPVLYYGSVATSLMLITVITLNRLVLIAFNDLYRVIYTKKKVNAMLAFCYLFSYGILAIPLLELYGSTGLQEETFSCTILRDSKGRSPKKFLFMVGFLLPMGTIVVSYSIIFAHVQRQSRINQRMIGAGGGVRGDGSGDKTSKTKTSKRDLRLTMLISVVFGTFVGCFLPLFVGNVLIPDDRYPYFHVLSSICAWLNACINPFIYFALNPRYRSAFKKLFYIRSSYNINGGKGKGRSNALAGGDQNVIERAELSTLSNENSRSMKWTSSKRASSSNQIQNNN